MGVTHRWALPALAAMILLGSAAIGQTEGSEDAVEPSREASSPFEAYRQGDYDVAVEGFRERANRRPKDPVRQLNLGSALHQTSEYAAAESALQRAKETADRSLRAAALYNLGNNSYHQGRLEEAVEHYRQALDLKPDDEDTKYNLEFVQQEIERRREQSQNRQQSPQDSQDESQEQQDQQDQGGQQNQDSQDGEQQPQSESQEGEDSSGDEGQDSDGDGLSDQQERGAENPTDPNNPDSDGDGRSDGEEDLNRNGRVDEGETNPNVPDQPGDGGEGQEQQQPGQEPQPGQGRPKPASMSPEDAARLLASLEDRRPPGARGKKVAETTKRSEKDW